MKKKHIVIGNWKMNPEVLKEAKALHDSIKKKLVDVKKTMVIIVPPSIFLSSLRGKIPAKKLHYGVQSVGSERGGAHTGEISAPMAKNMGAGFVLVGHSESRARGETDEQIAKKLPLILQQKMRPVLCVGEKSVDDQAAYLSFVKNQLTVGLSGVSAADIGQVIIAYEPVYAIGAAEPVTSHTVHQRNIFIKKVLSDLYGKTKAFEVPVLYGGSANADNASELVKGGEVDGLLVGRDSLKADNFISIAKKMDALS
jgi:triosephosphate isomerase